MWKDKLPMLCWLRQSSSPARGLRPDVEGQAPDALLAKAKFVTREGVEA